MPYIIDHGAALNYDLMTKTQYTLSDFPNESFTWRELIDFLKYLGHDSALVSELNPDTAYWEGERRLPMLIAALIDEISSLRWESVVARIPKGHKKPPQPKPYPRPGVDVGAKRTTYGKNGIKVKDFNDWWDNQNTHS